MESSKELLNKKFDIDSVRDFYLENLKFKSSVGIDKINNRLFEKKFKSYTKHISDKVINNRYRFTPYKQKLFLKGVNKPPRQISIPTIRDKITLGLLKEIIHERFKDEIEHYTVQTTIKGIEEELNNGHFDYFIKIDISRFYDSIDHDILMRKVRRKIRSKAVLDLIWRAIRTPTVSEKTQKKDRTNNTKGVPQGLPISNILSSIFLINFDKKHKNKLTYKYFRYVDDILILCSSTQYKDIKKEIVSELTSKTKYKLEINNDKKAEGLIMNGFDYLGYTLKPNSIVVRESSITKLEHSLERMFLDYYHAKLQGKENIDFFMWQLNLKITGSIFKKNKYGWVFFFSQISPNNEWITHKLDILVEKFINRFGMTKDVTQYKLRKFKRTYNEIRKNLNSTTYIPNFDKYSLDDKKRFIVEVLKDDLKGLSDEQISNIFNKKIYKAMRELEKDTQGVS
ncbi:reverse transcriptase domain-containing protein [Fredinandcohnia salidurans]|uniref:Reverse transcriptase domain-containing protein n=1 Tax=Fredinandcohnia salidurans TaxID=2595041 RepID=A0ABW4MNV6_9BACI